MIPLPVLPEQTFPVIVQLELPVNLIPSIVLLLDILPDTLESEPITIPFPPLLDVFELTMLEFGLLKRIPSPLLNFD